MLSSEEYNNLLPHREAFIKFHETGNMTDNIALTIIDSIRQRLCGSRPICWACEGDKIAAAQDGYNLIMEYESNEQAVKNG